jgi:hypothetical protein
VVVGVVVVVVVLVLVDVLVLVLVLANTDVVQDARNPKPAIATDFAIARGSAMECAAVLDVVRLLGVGTDEQHRQAVELLGRMLSKLSR